MNTENNVTPITETAKPTSIKRLNFDEEIARQIQERVAKLNETFTHVVNNGKNYIVRVGKNSLNQPYLEFFTVREFKDMLSHEPQVLVGFSKTMDEKQNPLLMFGFKAKKQMFARLASRSTQNKANFITANLILTLVWELPL